MKHLSPTPSPTQVSQPINLNRNRALLGIPTRIYRCLGYDRGACAPHAPLTGVYDA